MSLLYILFGNYVHSSESSIVTDKYTVAKKELGDICSKIKQLAPSQEGVELVDRLERCLGNLEMETGKNLYKKGFSDAVHIFLEAYSNK